MGGLELIFAKHVGKITHLLGGRAYAIQQLPGNHTDAGLMQGAFRPAWIVEQDGDDGLKPHYDCDNIVSLTVARDGTARISMGSLFEPVEESTRLYALLRYCAYHEVGCMIGGEMKTLPEFSFSGRETTMA